MVCVVGRMRDLILQLSKSSIYSTKPVRFTLVDVATGEWATWSPVNYEYKVLPPLPDKNEASTTDMTEQQIMQLKQKTYKAMVKDLVNRYQ
ncbi:aminopeptidase [Escherichia coli]|nr:aminopeptidase [Escherichia coli]